MNREKKERLYFLLQSEMSSKKLLKMWRPVVIVFLAVILLLIPANSFSEEIDSIAAVVNEQVITLTDVRVAETFGFYSNEFKEGAKNLRLLILEKLIDQKLVIQLSSEEINIKKEELDFLINEINNKTGSEIAAGKLEEFGMDWDDLREYLREKVIYQTIISRKFGHGNIVSLKEIGDYYSQIYVPSKREKGEEPQPMMELLEEIESVLKQEKVAAQIKDWIKNLRKKADIQIKKRVTV